jgi:hypothetical protein
MKYRSIRITILFISDDCACIHSRRINPCLFGYGLFGYSPFELKVFRNRTRSLERYLTCDHLHLLLASSPLFNSPDLYRSICIISFWCSTSTSFSCHPTLVNVFLKRRTPSGHVLCGHIFGVQNLSIHLEDIHVLVYLLGFLRDVSHKLYHPTRPILGYEELHILSQFRAFHLFAFQLLFCRGVIICELLKSLISKHGFTQEKFSKLYHFRDRNTYQ